ncbi:MAG: toll/interleukin-1 receptor domain-containing protein, partial [Rhodospirillales bacterium]
MARIFISHSSRDKEQAARLLEWLRGHGFVEAFLDFDKHTGLTPGGDWERTLYNQIATSEAVVLVLTRNWFESKWCFAEFTQARALGKVIFPVIDDPPGEGLVSPDIQHLNLVADREGGLERLAAELVRVAVNARSGFPWDVARPPFPGLLAFDESDAAIYFGRDDDIRRLIERLNARRALGGPKLVALLGASGSGKSSLLRAGVTPRLKRDKRNWIVLPPFRPQLHPVDELAQAVAAGLGAAGDWRKLRETLGAGDLGRAFADLGRDLRAAHGANEGQILVPIDQGEELFGASDKAGAERFLSVLNAMLGEGLPFIAVLGLRSDFLGQLQQAPGLSAAYEEFSLKPMPIDRVRSIIKEPARVAGITVDNALVAAAMKDAATDD